MLAEQSRAGGAQRELVLIGVGGQTFAIDIMALREIRGWTPTTMLPGAPAYVRGVVNLRGLPLPIIDLGLRLGFPPAEPDSRSAVAVVQITDRTVGLLVESVSEIISIDAASVQPPPDLEGMSSSAVSGLLAMADGMVGVLDISRLIDVIHDLPPHDLTTLDEAAG
jgi:purine-binding chemotaxis protein CheW